MRSDVLRRVRWGNVARAVGVVAAVGLIVAWPLLSSPSPSVPARGARPLVEPVPPAETTPGRGERRRGERTERAERRDRGGRGGGERRKAPARRRERAGRGEVATAGNRAPPRELAAPGGQPVGVRLADREASGGGGVVPAPPGDDPAQSEFGFEG